MILLSKVIIKGLNLYTRLESIGAFNLAFLTNLSSGSQSTFLGQKDEIKPNQGVLQRVCTTFSYSTLALDCI